MSAPVRLALNMSVHLGPKVSVQSYSKVKRVLSSPNFSSHPCSASESVPPGPELPESLRATDSTASSVMSTGIKIGVSSYVS